MLVTDRSGDIADRPVPLNGDEMRSVDLHIRRRLPGRRIDKFLHDRFPRMSRTLIQRLIKQGAVTVNGKPTKASYELNADDDIHMTIPGPEPTDIIPEPMPIDVIYEDRDMMAVNKPSGIICHPARATQTGTLANGLAHYAESLSHGDDPFRPGIIHRLDKRTTGIMLVAKSDEAHWRIALQFERRTIKKEYMAIVEGNVQLDGDVIDAPIGGHPKIKDKRIVPEPRLQARDLKEAVTQYEVIERFVGFTWVRLMPKTGRTHQLRVHMNHIGHPMAGDPMYGGHLITLAELTGRRDDPDEPVIDRQALHAHQITFRHPIREQEMTLQAPLPDDIQHVLALLRKHRQI